MRIESGKSGISPDDLRSWGLVGHVAWTMVCYADTDCQTKEARLELLKMFAEDIVNIVQKELKRREGRKNKGGEA